MPATSAMINWFQTHYGYANIMMGMMIAMWTKLFFRKYGYNFYEILILLCFVMGIGMLIFALVALFQGVTHVELMPIAGVIGIAYCSWAIGQFFEKKAANYLKAFFAYILGMISFIAVTAIVGASTDLIFKH
ncbi:hypothetical protein GCM10027037_05460 [Mucilaginibacter koreensis]